VHRGRGRDVSAFADGSCLAPGEQRAPGVGRPQRRPSHYAPTPRNSDVRYPPGPHALNVLCSIGMQRNATTSGAEDTRVWSGRGDIRRLRCCGCCGIPACATCLLARATHALGPPNAVSRSAGDFSIAGRRVTFTQRERRRCMQGAENKRTGSVSDRAERRGVCRGCRLGPERHRMLPNRAPMMP
jgi:hypothetical protein